MKLSTALLSFSLAALSTQSFAGIWENYCRGKGGQEGHDRKVVHVPVVNYSNNLVKKAVAKLDQVHPDSFYQYSDIERVYGLCSGSRKKKGQCKGKTGNKPANVKIDTHNFLTILCGEFRDNLRLLKSKLNWAANMHIVKNGKQGYDKNILPFRQLTAQGYLDLVDLSETVYELKHHALGAAGKESLAETQKSADAATICEYRYMLDKYLSKGEHFGYGSELSSYMEGPEGYLAYEAAPGNCTDDEKSHYYEFRGDGNFKAQSLESNAFIWNARIHSRSCKLIPQSDGTAIAKASGSAVITDESCQAYFKEPFSTRKELSKQGLARLFYYPEEYRDIMEDYDYSLVFVTEDLTGDDIAEMVVLESGQGANIVNNLRSKIKSARESGQFGMSKVYQQLIAYVVGKNVIQTGTLNKNTNAFKNLTKAVLISEFGKAFLEGKYTKSTKYADFVAQYGSETSKLGGLKKKVDKWQKTVKKKMEEEGKTESDLSGLISDIELVDGLIKATDFPGVTLVTDKYSSEVKGKTAFNKVFNESLPVNDDGKSAHWQAWDRVTIVLDRHTDWYKIDMLNLTLGVYIPTYSPWVASSYYINKSDAFTIPGYAMGLSGDGHRHWMFVQKVPKAEAYRKLLGKEPKSSWFRAQDMAEHFGNGSFSEAKFDMYNTWFDETTFSRSGLGADEQGWDRFGSASPEEVSELVYLYHASDLDQ